MVEIEKEKKQEKKKQEYNDPSDKNRMMAKAYGG